MSFIDDIEIYNDPIISKKRRGTTDDPYQRITETLTVESNGKVVLTELPNRKERVTVKNGTEYLMETEGKELTENLFNVDYTNGIIYFHSSLANQSLTFIYLGEGARFFPSSRIWLEKDGNNIINAKDKFSDIDRLILEQKTRVDQQIASNPQPSEVVDMRVDRNGVVYPVVKDRLDATQEIIEDMQVELQQTYDAVNGTTFTTLGDRLNDIDGRITSITDNVISLEDSLALKVDNDHFTGENIISKIELTPDEIKISANKINLTGMIGINAFDDAVYKKVNEAISASNLNLTGSLPTQIVMDTNGITAFTSDSSKYARLDQNGLLIKNGALTIERPDGYKVIDNGYTTFDFSVDSHDPPYKSNATQIVNEWWTTTSQSVAMCNYYTFRHTGRYLKMTVAFYSAQTPGTPLGGVTIRDNGNVYLAGTNFTNASDHALAIYGTTLTVDLGTPTGQMKSVYLALNSAYGNAVYLRKIRAWVEQ